jgi:hypothetical protein
MLFTCVKMEVIRNKDNNRTKEKENREQSKMAKYCPCKQTEHINHQENLVVLLSVKSNYKEKQNYQLLSLIST